MPSTPCVVPTCFKSNNCRHRFPCPTKYREMFDKWIVLCGNRRLITEMSPDNVYKTCRICSLHFTAQDFGNHNRLKNGVLPSLNLPDPLNMDTILPANTDDSETNLTTNNNGGMKFNENVCNLSKPSTSSNKSTLCSSSNVVNDVVADMIHELSN